MKKVKVTVKLDDLTKKYEGCKKAAEDFLQRQNATYNAENDTYEFVMEFWARYGHGGLAGVKSLCEIMNCTVLQRAVIE